MTYNCYRLITFNIYINMFKNTFISWRILKKYIFKFNFSLLNFFNLTNLSRVNFRSFFYNSKYLLSWSLCFRHWWCNSKRCTCPYCSYKNNINSCKYILWVKIISCYQYWCNIKYNTNIYKTHKLSKTKT